MDKRKPEWAPDGASAAFASSVVPGATPQTSPKVNRATKTWDPDELEAGIRAGNRTLLSRAITLVESNSNKHFGIAQELLQRLLPHSGNSVRIGITGVPGVGKSSFIERFGLYLISLGKKVAVLAIDPSSSISKGSILGDKTRMEELSRHEMSFIRPSPSSGVLGGVARKTRETIILCEAAGYDVILIETVGVGQSEITVRSMVDFFLLMQITGAGDELQGIKKGIMELADLIVVNKADGNNVERAKIAAREYNNALHYIRHATRAWDTKAQICSSRTGQGIPDIWQTILAFCATTKESGAFEERRRGQTSAWFEDMLQEAVLHYFYTDLRNIEIIPQIRELVSQGKLPVAYGVSKVMEHWTPSQS